MDSTTMLRPEDIQRAFRRGQLEAEARKAVVDDDKDALMRIAAELFKVDK